MGRMKDFDIRIRNGGDDAIAAVAEYTSGCEAWLKSFAALTKQVIPQWIPVEERLPEKERVVLICHRGTVGMARLYSDGWYWDMDEWHKPFTPSHWMPLPEPPTE